MSDEVDSYKWHSFLLHYDYGDDWRFTIHVQKIEEVDRYRKSKVLASKGRLEQYPGAWD